MKGKSVLLLVLLAALLPGLTSCWLFGSGSTPTSNNVTPSSYKMAIINMELTDSTTPGNNVTVINASADSPVIVDFTPGTSSTTLEDVLNAPSDPLVDGAAYDGYIITPLYMELELNAAFHVHASAAEVGYNLIFSADGDEQDYTFRFYFNPVENFWRRDIAVYLTGILDETDSADASYPDGWYWMRRALEPGGSSNFFILAQADDGHYDDSNPYPSHPVSGPAPVSIIDLFDNQTFWDDADDYDDPLVETVIDSEADTGGLKAIWDSFTYTTGDTITVTTNITDTVNFWYEANSDFTFTNLATDPDVIDFGPDYDDPSVSGDEQKYGDWGFHPFMPAFTTGTTPADS